MLNDQGRFPLDVRVVDVRGGAGSDQRDVRSGEDQRLGDLEVSRRQTDDAPLGRNRIEGGLESRKATSVDLWTCPRQGVLGGGAGRQWGQRQSGQSRDGEHGEQAGESRR